MAAQSIFTGVGNDDTLEGGEAVLDAEEETNAAPLEVTEARCAINFFGLPRSFAAMVLPSLMRNVFMRNAKYGCDYFVHFYHKEEEQAGRAGRGGQLKPEEVLLMKAKIRSAAKRTTTRKNPNPTVIFVNDTETEFWQQRGDLVEKFLTTKAEDGNYLYYSQDVSLSRITGQYCQTMVSFPPSLSYTPVASSMLARCSNGCMFLLLYRHSIQRVWDAMESHTTENNLPKYDRVAMMRLDVMYALPVDIFKIDKSNVDRLNKYAISPGFAKYPVNDRMFYGPYEAVKIWATERFTRIESHVHSYEPGWGMHSERFLESAIFSAIKEQGVEMKENPDLCVMRVRADLSVWMNDCITMSGTTRGIKRISRQKLVELILGRPCTKSKHSRRIYQLHCPLQ
jgi:hypothetical protein